MTTEKELELREAAEQAMLEYIVSVADRTGVKAWKLTEPWEVSVSPNMQYLIKHELAHMEQCLLTLFKEHMT